MTEILQLTEKDSKAAISVLQPAIMNVLKTWKNRKVWPNKWKLSAQRRYKKEKSGNLRTEKYKADDSLDGLNSGMKRSEGKKSVNWNIEQ